MADGQHEVREQRTSIMTWMPKTAFVLAAGLGTRMRPLTDTMPKPLVVFDGKPLIDHVLDRIAAVGIARVIVNVHHHADKLERHLSSRTYPEIIISDERDALLDTGGGAVRALSKLGDEPFLIHNSDSVWIEDGKANLVSLARMWDSSRMDSLMLLADTDSSLGYDGRGDFSMAPDGQLSRWRGENRAPYVFAGVSIAHPRLFKGAPHGRFSLNSLWDQAIANRRLFGVPLEGTWMHIGTPQALAEAELLVKRRASN